MIVYHGTTQVILKPDISFSKKYLDFGSGFYLTTYQKQAEKWALRKAIRQNRKAVVNVYELLDNLNPYRLLQFNHENEKWLDFVCACRKGEEINKEYDIIIGNVADDDVFKTVDMYVKGIWMKEKVLNELKYYKSNDQICITNQQVLNNILIYQNSYEVNGYD